MIQFQVSPSGHGVVNPSPRSNSPIATVTLVVILAGVWCLLWKGLDPSNLFRQHVDNQMMVLEVILLLVTGVGLVLLARFARLHRRWLRPLQRSGWHGLRALSSELDVSLEDLGRGGALQVELIAGPEVIPPGILVRTALGSGRRVLLLGRQKGATAREVLGTRGSDELEIWQGPVSDSELAGWVRRQSEPFTIVLLGAGALSDWVLGERAEVRLARLLDGLPEANVSGDLQIVEPLTTDRVVRPDPFAQQLLSRVHQCWLWNGTQKCKPMREKGGFGWWLVHGRGPQGLGPSGSAWDAWMMGVATLSVLGLAVVMVLWPTFSDAYAGTPLLGRMDDALPGSLWSNWWVQQWYLGEQELLFSDAIFWPQGAHLVPLIGNLGASLLSIPFQQVGAYPDYWNIWIGCCLLANGLATFWLARQVGADRVGALLAGLAMTLAAPVLVEVNGGHQSQFLVAGLPICIGLSLRVLDLNGRWDVWLLGLALSVTSLIWWVMGGVAWVVLLAMLGHRLWHFRSRRRLLGSRLWKVFCTWSPCLLMAGPLIALVNNGKLKGMGWGRLVHDSADTQVEDLMLVSLLEHSVEPEALLTGGLDGLSGFVTGFLILGMIVLWRFHRTARCRLWGLLLGLSALLSLGPYLSPTAGFSRDWLVLPTGWLQALTPFATRFHQPDRMLIVAALALAIMIGRVYRPLQLSMPRRFRGLPLAAGLVALFGLPWMQERLPLDVYDFDMPGWYEHLGLKGAMIEVPMGLSEVPAMYQPVHGRSVATGPGVVREMVDADGYRALVHTNPAINKLWEYDPVSKDASDLMRMRDDGLRYIVINSGVIEYLITTQGMDRARVMLLVSRWLDNTLGPPVLSAYQARVYRIPDETEGSLLLASQHPDEEESAGEGEVYVPVPVSSQPVPRFEENTPGMMEDAPPAFEDIEEAFSPDYDEP